MKLLSICRKQDRQPLPKALVSIGWGVTHYGAPELHIIIRMYFWSSECVVYGHDILKYGSEYSSFHFRFFGKYRELNGKHHTSKFIFLYDKELKD